MSLFDNIYGTYILEDDMGDDDQTQQQNQDNPDDAGSDDTQNQETPQEDNPDEGGDDQGEDDEYSMDDNNQEDTTDENQDDQDQQDDQGEDDEYSMDDDEEGGEDNPDEGGDDQGEDDDYSMDDDNQEDNTDDSSTDENQDPSQKLKDIEKSIFDQLTPEQQNAKTQELKNLYGETYEKCQSIIDIVSNIEKAPDQAKVYDYIIKNLVDLQKYIRDYLENLFDSKTYIENMTELQKYLAILDTINNVFEEMQKKANIDTKQ